MELKPVNQVVVVMGASAASGARRPCALPNEAQGLWLPASEGLNHW